MGGNGGSRILVVEDHADTSAALARLLTQQGYHVDQARSLRAATELLSSSSYDTVLTDIGLPDGNGCDLMDAVRCAGASERTRGIVLSGFTDEATVCAAREAGFSRFLAKPVAFADVLKAIEETSAWVTRELVKS
jgi:DNA-binding response OmpR family regulator